MSVHPYHAKLKRTLDRRAVCTRSTTSSTHSHRSEMQSCVEGESLAITRIAIYPRGKVVEVLAVVGRHRRGARPARPVLIFAAEVGARVIQAFGRQGWMH